MNHDGFINDFINKKTIKFIPSPSSVNFKKIPRRKLFPRYQNIILVLRERKNSPHLFTFSSKFRKVSRRLDQNLDTSSSLDGHRRNSNSFLQLQKNSSTTKQLSFDAFPPREISFSAPRKEKKRALIKTGRDCLRDVT